MPSPSHASSNSGVGGLYEVRMPLSPNASIVIEREKRATDSPLGLRISQATVTGARLFWLFCT
jgi:hypothetical protein